MDRCEIRGTEDGKKIGGIIANDLDELVFKNMDFKHH